MPLEREPSVESRLRNFVALAGIPLTTVATACGLPKASVLDWWSKREDGIVRDSHAALLCLYFGIPEDILSRPSHEIPFKLIRQRMTDGAQALPDVFTAGARSPLRGLVHITEFLTLYLGKPAVDRLFTRMNVHPRIFDAPDTRVNLNFTLALFKCLEQTGFSDDDISGLGRFISLSHQTSACGQHFVGAENVKESYAILGRHIGEFDQNFEYRFQFRFGALDIVITPHENTRWALRIPESELLRYLNYQKKLLGWFPTLSGLSPVEFETLQGLDRGDDRIVYRHELTSVESENPKLLSLLAGPAD